MYMIEVYKIMMKGLHLNYSILLIKAQARTHGHSLKVTNHFFLMCGHSLKVTNCRSRLEICNNFFTSKVVNVWSSLTDSLARKLYVEQVLSLRESPP